MRSAWCSRCWATRAVARGYYERALALAEKSSSPRIQDFLRANIAGLWIDEGQFEPAARVLEEVLARGLDAFPSLRYTRLSYAQSEAGPHRPGARRRLAGREDVSPRHERLRRGAGAPERGARRDR